MIAQLALLGVWDWAFVGWFLLVTLGVGLWYSKRASSNLDEYFLSGRKLPWWALGTSMVATTFAADTPIVVAGFVIAGGIAKNWLWWSFLFGGTLTVFVFARWWRRAEVVTEIELIDKRYDGAAARGLRTFKALFLGLFVNAIIFGFVTKAMSSVCAVVFDVDPWVSLAILLSLAFVYTALAGLWGVVATDVLQFVMAMLGAILLAVVSVAEVGGLGELVTRVEAATGGGLDILAIFPTGWDVFTASVVVLVLVNWWAVYYPGAEPGGGGYVAQRMSAALDEDHARKGTLWFICAHYVIRPWPWILVGLAAIALEPRFLTDAGEFKAERAYPWMFQFLPVGILGLVVASFFAAFMSTITTTLNLSASYLVNDCYLPMRGAAAGRDDARHRVWVARIAVAIVAIAGTVVSLILESAGDGWTWIMHITAGTGPVLILRWLWWRINAWSEITAMLASACGMLIARIDDGAWLVELVGGAGPKDELQLVFIVIFSVAWWLPVTLLTRPVGEAKLAAFYRRVRPGGAWARIADHCGLPRTRLGIDLSMWLASTVMIFGALLGLGSALLQDPTTAVIALGFAVLGGVVLSRLFVAEKRAKGTT